MCRCSVFVLLLCTHITSAQSVLPTLTSAPPQSPLQLSPQAAYDQAIRPLDIVRREAGNWSDVELAALNVAVDEAKTACQTRNPAQFAGEDLLAYARLCTLAQMWPQVQSAGTNYLVAYGSASPADRQIGFPNLSMAFDYVIQASLHQKNATNAVGTAQTMLRTVAYDEFASDAVNATVRYVQLIHTDQALILLRLRQPQLLTLMKAGASVASATAAQPAAPRAAMAIHTLYADAIALPAMLQFADQPEAAASSIADLDAALPTNLSPDDSILTAASRRQYRLLGSPLPTIEASAWLLDRSFALPRSLNTKSRAASVYLLFPDWCAQCVAMGSQFVGAVTRLNTSAVHFYALLAQADPKPPTSVDPPTSAPKGSGHAAPRSAASSPGGATFEPSHVDIQATTKPVPAQLLIGTPTLIVPPKTLDTFVATDFPLLIATDHDGVVRYIQTAPDNVLAPGGLADQIAERIVSQWPTFTNK